MRRRWTFELYRQIGLADAVVSRGRKMTRSICGSCAIRLRTWSSANRELRGEMAKPTTRDRTRVKAANEFRVDLDRLWRNLE